MVMSSKQRVLTILNHQEADRVPYDYWAVPEMTERLKEFLHLSDEESLLKYFDVDLRYFKGPSYLGQRFKEYPDGIMEDIWGVRRKKMKIESKGIKWTYWHVEISPLQEMTTVEEIDKYPKWPSPDWWDYSTISQDCDKCKEYTVVYAGDRLDRTAQLKPAMYLRGMEQIYIDLVMNPEIVESIISHINEYFLEYNMRVFEEAKGKIDIFMMGDDFGTQNGLIIDLRLWKKYFQKGFRQHIDLAHKYGIKVMHHTCGSVKELIPEFIDAGLDIIQSLQPRAKNMDLEKLKKEYGKYISFHGSIDIQETLPQRTVDDVRKEVEKRMKVGKSGGGFIISTAHNIQPDTPIENILALFKAYKEFGGYD